MAASTGKSNYHLQVSKHFESYVDLFSESHISFEESGGYVPLSYCKSEEAIWEMLSGADPDGEVDSAEYLAYLGLSVSVMDLGKCKKCNFAFVDECSEYLPKHCTKCGTKRPYAKSVDLIEVKDSDYKVIRKGLWEASIWSAKIQSHFTKKQISRYWVINISHIIEFDVSGKTLAQVEKLAKSDDIWFKDFDNTQAAGALPCGICSKCNRDFLPLEKFCAKCGSKNNWKPKFLG